MKRSLSAPIVALALSACSREAPPVPPPVTAAAPTVEVRRACPADATTLPTFSLRPDPNARDHLQPELLPAPVRGLCVQELQVFRRNAPGALNASMVETAQGPRLAVQRINAGAVLATQKLVLVGADTGLWALDPGSMARLARLVPHRVVDVDTTADGARFAYVRQDATDGDTPNARELVVVDTATLGVVRRIANVPEGRLRLSSDGKTLVLVVGGVEGVTTYDVESGSSAKFETDAEIRDAVALVDRPGVVGYVGDDNTVSFHDVRGGELAQSSTGAAPLVATRDLLAIEVDPTTHHILAGGADHQMHEYEGMLGEHPRDLRQVQLEGNALDIAFGAEGGYAVATDTVHVAWIKDGAIVREVGPMMPERPTAIARVGLVDSHTIVSTIGRVFNWTRDGLFVEADYFSGEELARTTLGNDVLVALRTGPDVQFHRIPAGTGLLAQTTHLGTGPWAVVDGTFETPNGGRMFVGRQYTHAAVAFVPAQGEITLIEGPEVGLVEPLRAVPRGDGIHWALWDLRDAILEIDVAARTITAAHRIEGAVPTALTLTWETDHWKAVDQATIARTLTPIPPPPTTRPPRVIPLPGPAAQNPPPRRGEGTPAAPTPAAPTPAAPTPAAPTQAAPTPAAPTQGH